MNKNITHLTSVEAVEAAIAECDALGRDEFLKKYGYKRATKYALLWHGREYDSKAIAGVAFEKQHGVPMAWDAFSGGLERTVPTLEKLGFNIKGGRERNPEWNRDERMLALHFYLQHRKAVPGNRSAEVAELSQLLVRMSAHGKTTSTYRNPPGVYMKLMNFRSIDPEFQAQGKQGLSQCSKEDQVVWDLYADNEERLGELVTQIKAAIDIGPTETGIADDDEHDIEDCEEGRIFTRMHRFRERNRKLVLDFKERYRQKHGTLKCAGCDFDFADKYGSLAERLIDVHHTKPVHTLKPGDKTSPKDLVLLCASCHRAVHARKAWMTIVELRRQLGKAS